MEKKLLMLGASYFQVPAIKYAKEAGYHVITVDYLPDNPGHIFSDEYYNISTLDKDRILKLSKELRIDGILSYASDPGAPTAAYVAERMNLPGNPYESVRILQRKDLFRGLLKNMGLNVPISEAFIDIKDAIHFSKYLLLSKSIIIKPSDSSGSKGVRRVTSLDDFDSAFCNAKVSSHNGVVVIEEFIEKDTFEMDGDGFVWNGKLVFRCFGNQHNDIGCNPYVPVGISFPYIQKREIQDKAHLIIESILTKLDMKLGGLNIEYLTNNNNIYILEVGPRNGGNLIPEVIKYSTGVDLIKWAVESALGKDCSELQMKQPEGHYSSYIIHSKRDGTLKKINISQHLEKYILERNIWKKSGDIVQKFMGSNNTIGTLVLQFSNKNEMLEILNNIDKYVEVILEVE